MAETSEIYANRITYAEIYAKRINYDISRIYEVPLTWREHVRVLIEEGA